METLYVCDVTEGVEKCYSLSTGKNVLLTINVFLDNVLLLCIALDPVKYRN